MADEALDSQADAAVASIIGGTDLKPQPTMQSSVAVAVGTNPDMEAELRRVALRTGVPVQTVAAQPDEMKKKAALADINFDEYQSLYPASAVALSDVELAKVAHDDTENMGYLENTLRGIGGRIVNLGGALGRFGYTIDKSVARLVAPDLTKFADDLEGLPGTENLRSAEKFTFGYKPRTTWEDVKDSPLSNFLPFALEQGLISTPDMAAAIFTPAAYFPALTAEFGQHRAENDQRKEATLGDFIKTAPAAFANALLERLMVKNVLSIGATEQGLKEIAKGIGKAVVKGGAIEAGQNLAQYTSETAGTKKGFDVWNALEQVAQGFVAGGPFGGLMHGASVGIKSATDRMSSRVQVAAAAENAAKGFEELNALATASKLKERDPLAFQNFMESVAKTEGTVENVYVDPRALAQAGINVEELAQASPSVAAQVRVALETGEDIKIPVSEYATHLAGSDLGQAMVDHLKIDPLAMSRAEAKEFMQGHAEQLKGEVEKAVAEQTVQDKFQQSANAVREDLVKKLGVVKRFTDEVNNQYATLLSNFYKVQAARLGTTAEELYAKHPVNIQSVLDSGSTLDQAARDSAFKNWFGESKVTDKEGKPLVMYHGTGSDIKAFSNDFLGLGNDQAGSGFYFSSSPSEASGYANSTVLNHDRPGKTDKLPGKGSPNVMPVHLSIKKPLSATEFGNITADQVKKIISKSPNLDEALTNWGDVEHEGKANVLKTAIENYVVKDGLILNGLHPIANDFFAGDAAAFNKAVRDVLGYDGVVVDGGDVKHYIAWFPEQIKSVHNQGTYDPNDSNILHQDKTTPTPTKNTLGLYSGVEKEVLTMNLPGWKANPKKALTPEEEARLQELHDSVRSTAHPDYQELVKLRAREKEAEGAATGKEIWEKIKSSAVKQEELKWLGLEDFLKASTEKLTRQDVVDFIQQNGVHVEEVVADKSREDTNSDFNWDREVVDDPEYVNSRAEDIKSDLEDDSENINDAVRGIIRKDKDYVQKGVGEGVELLKDGDPTPEALEWVQENFADEIDQYMTDLAQERAQEEYDDNPYYKWTDSTTGFEIIGNDDVGYTIEDDRGRRHDGGYSFNEAELRARDLAMERGVFEDEDSPEVAKWEDYVTPGRHDNYRELKLTLPDLEGDFHNDVHFPDRNIVAFLRVTDRKLQIPYTAEQQKEIDAYDARVKEILSTFTDEIPENYFGSDGTKWKDWLAMQEEKIAENEKAIAAKKDALLQERLQVEETRRVRHDVSGEEAIDELQRLTNIRKRDIERKREQWRDDANGQTGLREVFAKRLAAEELGGWEKSPRNKYATQAKTFFIDEMQSDWHQDGRKEGYQTGEDAGALDMMRVEKERETNQAALELFDPSRPDTARLMKTIRAFRDFHNPDYRPTDRDAEDLEGVRLLVELRDAAKKSGGVPEGSFEGGPSALYESIKDIPGLQQVLALADETRALRDRVHAERHGVPDAPFKGDSWLNLGLKRALTLAVEKDYDALAWADAEVLMDRWSQKYETLYRTQYDTKMVSAMQKLTKQKPQHLENDRGAGYWTVPLTKELKAKIKQEGFPLFQDQKNMARGSFNPDTSTITLLQNADLSTFLHETGHFFLEMMNKLALDPNAPDAIKQDMQTTLDWLGVKDLAEWNAHDLEWQREKHEQFARGFEAYLFEGKSPSVEMRGVFQRFRAWLLNVYRHLSALNVQLTDEVRGVFDRMLATSEQIKDTELARSFEPMFSEQRAAGMTPEEWQQYQELGLQATQDAITSLESRSLRDLKWLSNARSRALKDLQREAAGRRREIRDQVTKEVMDEPVNQARTFLTKGELNGEKVLEGGTKLSLPEIEAMYGDSGAITHIKQALGSGKYGMLGVDKGMHPDQVAEMFGFSSGDELVRALLAAEKPQDKIAGLTDQRMLEKYGDLTNPDTLARAADEAVHNDARARFVASELNALQKATGGRKILTEAARNYAEQMIARLKVRDISPSRYVAAETRAAKAAAESFKAGGLAAAAVEKRNQLIQNYAAKAAHSALAEVERAVRYFKKFEKAGSRENIATSSLDQIDALLERFDLRKGQSLKAIDKRTSLASWIKEQNDIGIEPEIPPELVEQAQRKHFKDMTVEELRGLRDTVKQIEHIGRLKNRLLTAKDKREFKAVVDGLVESINTNAGGRVVDNRTRANKRDQVKRLFKGFVAQHRKVASLARELDGFKDAGPMWETMIRTMNEAGDKEAKMRADATRELAKIVKPILSGGKMGGKGIYFPSIDKSLNREERIAFALNVGNEGNKQRLLDGEGWTQEQIAPVLDTLTKEDWDFVQNIWEFFERFRPEIGAKEKRVYGKEPEWVDPTPVQTKFGEYKGGYYPVKYDTRRSIAAEQHSDAEYAKQQMKGAYTSATTRRSFTKSRAEEVVGRPLLYAMDGLYNGVNEIIHDLSWHEWLIDANRLLRNKALDNAIRTGYGADVTRQFKDAVTDIAGGEQPAGTSFERAIGDLRHGAVVAGIGFNIVNTIINVTGMTNSIVRVGPKWVGMGIAKFSANPRALVKEVGEKSEFMRLRSQTMLREVNEIQNQVRGKSRARAVMDTLMFAPLTYTQMVVDTPTWYGAYQKALTEGHPEDRAVALADQAVLDAQSGGQIKDLSKIQRGPALQKLFTTFYGYFNASFNLAAEKTNATNFRDPASVMRLGGNYLLLSIVPAFMGSIINNILTGGDKDWQPEKLAKRVINDQISYMMGMLVGLREVTGAVQTVSGTNPYTSSYGGPAGLRFFQEFFKLAQQIHQGEADDALRKSIINVAGILFKLPAAQINRSIDGAEALIEGKSHNPLALVAGAPKQK